MVIRVGADGHRGEARGQVPREPFLSLAWPGALGEELAPGIEAMVVFRHE